MRPLGLDAGAARDACPSDGPSLTQRFARYSANRVDIKLTAAITKASLEETRYGRVSFIDLAGVGARRSDGLAALQQNGPGRGHGLDRGENKSK
jgi:hypothetical protein